MAQCKAVGDIFSHEGVISKLTAKNNEPRIIITKYLDFELMSDFFFNECEEIQFYLQMNQRNRCYVLFNM